MMLCLVKRPLFGGKVLWKTPPKCVGVAPGITVGGPLGANVGHSERPYIALSSVWKRGNLCVLWRLWVLPKSRGVWWVYDPKGPFGGNSLCGEAKTLLDKLKGPSGGPKMVAPEENCGNPKRVGGDESFVPVVWGWAARALCVANTEFVGPLVWLVVAKPSPKFWAKLDIVVLAARNPNSLGPQKKALPPPDGCSKKRGGGNIGPPNNSLGFVALPPKLCRACETVPQMGLGSPPKSRAPPVCPCSRPRNMRNTLVPCVCVLAPQCVALALRKAPLEQNLWAFLRGTFGTVG